MVNRISRVGHGLWSLLALAAAAPAAAQLVLYEDADFQGRAYTAATRTPSLAAARFENRASSAVVRSGRWQLCSEPDFSGRCIQLSPGSYAALRDFGMHDRVSSVRPWQGADQNAGNSGNWGNWGGWGGGRSPVELFEHEHYGGRTLTLDGDVAALGPRNFNDTATSLIVRSGRWDFCVDADYRGRCVTLGPGSYPDLRDLGLHDEITSVRPSSGPGHSGGWTGGRPGGGYVLNDDGGAPEIAIGSNRYGRATFVNGCIVYYNPSGQRFQNLPSCDGLQIRRADEAMRRHRSEQGLSRVDDEHPWAHPSGIPSGRPDPTPPEIIMGTNREGEVIFRNNCVVYFNALGRRYRQQPSCSPEQLRRADVAMAAHRREQGL